MDIYVIPPTSALYLSHEGDRYFCLAQIYKKNEDYRKFFKQVKENGGFITLDNGAGDHDVVSKEELIDMVEDLLPNEFIPLDILFDKKQTLFNLQWTIDELQKRNITNVNILAVPQGKDLPDYLDCYKQMIYNPRVSTVGLSKITVPKVVFGLEGDINIGLSRNILINILQKTQLLVKPIHFLGAGEPDEFIQYKHIEMCRSTDSCFTIWGGMNEQDFKNPDYIRIPTPKNYFELYIDKHNLSTIRSNIQHLKSICHNNVGVRHNSDKLEWSLIHYDSLAPMVQALMYGAKKKYSANNWQKGFLWSKVFDSAMRHLLAIKSGELIDAESGIRHIGLLMSNAMFLSYMEKNRPDLNDIF